MDRISKVWFDDKRIYIETEGRKILSRPLEAFPCLKDASGNERADFKIGKFGDDIRWETLDEDVHINSFYETAEPNADNEVGRIFLQFPQLDISGMAQFIGINKSLLDKYIYGMKEPSKERMEQIKEAIHTIGQQLIAI